MSFVSLNNASQVAIKRETGFFENLGNAYAYQYSPLVAKTQEFVEFEDVERDPDFNPVQYIDSKYLEYGESLIKAKNKDHFDSIVSRIDKSLEIRKDLENVPWYAPSQIIAGVADPLNVAFAIPFFGQAGLGLRVGASLGSNVVRGAAGGALAGAVGEAFRAPFDPVATKEESAATVAASAAIGGLLGTAPTIYRSAKPYFNRTEAKVQDLYEGKGELVDIDDVEIKSDDKLSSAVSLAVKDGKVTSAQINNDIIEDTFENGYFAKPQFGGFVPDRLEIDTPERMKSYLVFQEEIKLKEPRIDGETAKQFETRVNKKALNKTLAGENLKKTYATESVWFKALTSPMKRLLLSENVPNQYKQVVNKLQGAGAMALDRNVAGSGHQSIYQRIPNHRMVANNAEGKLRAIYEKEVFGESLPILERNQIRNLQRYKDKVLTGQKPPSYTEWFESMADKRFQFKDPGNFSVREKDLTDLDKEAFEILDNFFDEFRVRAQDQGLLKDTKSAQQWMDDAGPRLERLIQKQDALEAKPKKTKKDTANIATLKKQIEELEIEIEYHKYLVDVGEESFEYLFPINYLKASLNEDAALKKEFTDVIADHIRSNPRKFDWDAQTKRYVKAQPKDPLAEAKKIVANILEDPDGKIEPRGGKHLRHRSLKIPEYKIAKFIYKNPEVLHVYAEKMGKRIEYTRNFGKKDSSEILTDLELDMRTAGASEKEISNAVRDLSYLFDYTMGRHISTPDRIDNQLAKTFKEFAGWAFMHGAGVSAITDTGMIAFERGFKDAFVKPLSNIQLVAKGMKEADQIVESARISAGAVKQQISIDLPRRIDPNITERVLNPISNVYYNIPIIGNNLGLVTKVGRLYDGVVTNHAWIEKSQLISKNKAKPTDVEELARYGITEDDARQIARYIDEGIIQSENNFFLANTDAWPRNTAAERELFNKWQTATNNHALNTIMQASAFDKPMIMDGAVYVRHNTLLSKLFGLEIDKNASTQNTKLARLESGILTMPFQFYNFALAATTRITTQVFDPSRQNRLAGVVALYFFSYLSLSIKNNDKPWWKENQGFATLQARYLDHSGILGVYSDFAYMALHNLYAQGVLDENFIIKGKYKATAWDAALEPLGASPGQLRDITLAVADLMEGRDTQAARDLARNIPFMGLFGLQNDMAELIGGRR